MKRVVITGATGTIGRALIKVCIKAGYEVLSVVHRQSLRSLELDSINQCKVLRLDLNEYDHAMEEIEKQGIAQSGYEMFFHLAWMAPSGTDRDNLDLQLSNVETALKAVKFAKALGCSTFIGTGSQAEYGRVEETLSPSTRTNPETGYGIAKLCAGQITRVSCEQLGLCHVWCRVLSVFGPYDRDQALISYAVRHMIKNEETEFSPCNQIWDFLYSDDAARAILLAGEKGENGKVYVVGSGEKHKLKKYIQTIADIIGYKKEIGFGRKPYGDKQVMYLCADISELHRLGYRQNISFEEGIRKMMIYYSNNIK